MWVLTNFLCWGFCENCMGVPKINIGSSPTINYGMQTINCQIHGLSDYIHLYTIYKIFDYTNLINEYMVIAHSVTDTTNSFT